jgi:hypothetical protein
MGMFANEHKPQAFFSVIVLEVGAVLEDEGLLPFGVGLLVTNRSGRLLIVVKSKPTTSFDATKVVQVRPEKN